jgi:hypothetical protein
MEVDQLAIGGPQLLLIIEQVNGRIDKCVKDSAVFERVLWVILSLVLFVGLSVLIYGALQGSKLLIGLSVGETGVTVWPVTTLIKLHRRRIALAVVPEITVLLSPRDAAREIHALIALLLDRT